MLVVKYFPGKCEDVKQERKFVAQVEEERNLGLLVSVSLEEERKEE